MIEKRPHPQKGIIGHVQFGYQLKIFPILYTKKKIPAWYKKLCIGTTYFHQYKQISFSVHSTVGVPTTFGKAACTYHEPENKPLFSGPGFPIFQIGKSGFSVPGTKD